MKICSIRIKGFQQFDDLFLDFTHPETGEPLDKICFIGANGTGKSTICSLINEIVSRNSSFFLDRCNVIIEFKYEEERFFYFNYREPRYGTYYCFSDSIAEEQSNWFDNVIIKKGENGPFNLNPDFKKHTLHQEFVSEFNSLLHSNNAQKTIIFSPSESNNNSYLNVKGVPLTTLNHSLEYFKNFPNHHIVSNENVNEFWTVLIYLIKKRDNEREEFENNEQNLNKTKLHLIEEFEKISPKILDKLAELWNRILSSMNLELDVETAKSPIQLNDNLHAYIINKTTKERIRYDQLSTGIRNFIFRVGHIYSLYFNREIENGFLIIDEPENNLFPDFLYDLIEVYQEIMIDKNGNNNTQFFVSTHSPIIAAQFEPYERIILKWDENAHVYAEKGYAPIGDDPNDVLTKDFELRNLMGKAGIEAWERYILLNKELQREKDPNKKEQLILELSKLGMDYNFNSHYR
jgi:predicted ATP-dependent endonuclease of OLD family